MLSWSNEVKNIFYNCNLNNTYDSMKCTMDTMKENFKVEQADFLKHECEQKPKLRTFLKFKQFNAMPAYVTKPLTFLQKKHLSKIRLGSQELRIESGMSRFRTSN